MEASREERPLGLMVPPVEHGVEIPPEPPDVGARALYIAGRLLAGATTFFFLAFLFAYFYLRSLNQNHMWRPGHVKADQAPGRRDRRLRAAERRAGDRRRPADEGAIAQLAGPGDRRAGARARGDRAAVRRVHGAALRPDRRRICERLLRLDGVLRDRGAGDDVLAGDAGRDRAARTARRPRRRNRRTTSRTPTG